MKNRIIVMFSSGLGRLIGWILILSLISTAIIGNYKPVEAGG